jgi:hypothetical protein
MNKITVFLILLLIPTGLYAQTKFDSVKAIYADIASLKQELSATYSKVQGLTEKDLRDVKKRFEVNKQKVLKTSEFLSAANNSLDVLASAIDVNDYKTLVIDLNNPTNEGLGFNLQKEVIEKLRPLISKAKKTNKTKFSEIVTSILQSPASATIKTFIPASSVLSTVLGLVGTLTVNEETITKADLEIFQSNIAKYFALYERLSIANESLRFNLEKLKIKNAAVREMLKAMLIERVNATNPTISIAVLKDMTFEDILLDYYNVNKLSLMYDAADPNSEQTLKDPRFFYPADGAITAREIANDIEKAFNEYDAIYLENYRLLKSIVTDSAALNSDPQSREVHTTLKNLQEKYENSVRTLKLSSKIRTLFENLRAIPVF